MKKRVTSLDVAKAAGVSRATVSYVLNNKAGAKVSAATAGKVLTVSKKIGYFPDFAATSLKTHQAFSVGVVSGYDISELRLVQILQGIKNVLSRHNYNILLCSSKKENDGVSEYERLYYSKKIDGVIHISRQDESMDFSNLNFNVTSVFVDFHMNNPDINSVDINYSQCAYDSAKYLIDNGHRKFIYFAPAFATSQESERMEGIMRACSDNNIPAENIKIVDSGAVSAEEEKNKILGLLNNLEDYTALIVSWASFAFEVLNGAVKIGLKVPDDLKVISLSASPFANFSCPSLTSIQLPLIEIGERSAEILLNAINGEQEKQNVVINGKLRIRDSA